MIWCMLYFTVGLIVGTFVLVYDIGFTQKEKDDHKFRCFAFFISVVAWEIVLYAIFVEVARKKIAVRRLNNKISKGLCFKCKKELLNED